MRDITSETLPGVEYEPEYGEIESILSQLDESSDPLSRSYEQPKINWYHITEMAEILLGKCFDLRVMVWLTRANLQHKGVSALYESLMNLHQRIHDRSSVIYPRSEEEPVNGGHAAALGWLATTQCIAEIKAIRITPEHPFTLQSLVVNEHNAENLERHSVTSSAAIISVNSYFQKNGLPDLITQLSEIDSFLEKISLYANKYSEGYQLNCNLLKNFLKNLLSQLSKISRLNEKPQVDSEISEPKLRLGESHDNMHSIFSDKKISSRQEVIVMLDHILEYFQIYEPSHPAPIFIYRTKEMIGMDFYSIVEDILPEAAPTLKQLAGKNNPTIQ